MLVARSHPSAQETAFLSDFPLIRSYPALLVTMIEEIREQASEEQSRTFFAAVGARLAALAPLNDAEDAEVLVAKMNDLWRALGWGSVALSFDDGGVDIFHSNLPLLRDSGEEEMWMAVAPHILEGTYDCWFRSLGSGPKLRTRVVRTEPDLLELRHGL